MIIAIRHLPLPLFALLSAVLMTHAVAQDQDPVQQADENRQVFFTGPYLVKKSADGVPLNETLWRNEIRKLSRNSF